MKVVQSSSLNLYNDMANLFNEDEVVFAYLIHDRIAIWDPTWVNEQEETLADTRFNEDYIQKCGIPVLSMPLTGGTIVNNLGDIGVLVISKDLKRKWEIDAMRYLQEHLLYNYDIATDIHGNDMLINGRKFLGSSMGFLNGRRLGALFIGINCDTDWLIKKICIKENKHKGFDGLSKYGVNSTTLIKRLQNFTRKWEVEENGNRN